MEKRKIAIAKARGEERRLFLKLRAVSMPLANSTQSVSVPAPRTGSEAGAMANAN